MHCGIVEFSPLAVGSIIVETIARWRVSRKEFASQGWASAEEALLTMALASHEALEKAGIENVLYGSQGTANEWHTWRRDLHEFAPRLF